MTYCAERTRLLVKAGRDLATRLLPAPFTLWYSDHSTGIQMTIVAPGPTKGEHLYVWKGSIWHSPIYEFNDRGDIAGLQPDFEFARDVIDGYFASVEKAVLERDTAVAAHKELQAKVRAGEAIAAVKSALGQS